MLIKVEDSFLSLMESLNLSQLAIEKSNDLLPPSYVGFSSNHLVVQCCVQMLKNSSWLTSSHLEPDMIILKWE